MIALTDRMTLYLSKPEIRLKSVPPDWLERRRKELGADEIRIGTDRLGIPYLSIVAKEIQKPSRIVTSVDLRPWFTQKSCLKDWETFNRCMNAKRNETDAFIYRKLDREFVAKIICEEGQPCVDPTFARWRLRWIAPAYIQLEADIGEGGFASLQKAKESLHAINALLKKTLYGARFPEDFGEGRSEYELFSLDTVRIANFDFKKAVTRLLRRLRTSGFLTGLRDRDIEKIGQEAKGGKTIYYLPARCAGGQAEGWFAISNGSHVRFDLRRCPHLEITR